MTNLPINFYVVFNGNTRKLMLENFQSREEAVRYIQNIEEGLKECDRYLPYQFSIVEINGLQAGLECDSQTGKIHWCLSYDLKEK